MHFDNRSVLCFSERLKNAYGALGESAERAPDATAIVYEDGRWTYRETVAEVARISTGLRQRGVKRGDRVALIIGNRPEFIFAFYAVLHAGAIAIPIDIRLQRQEVEYIAQDAGVTMFVCEAGFAERVPETAAGGPVACVSFNPDAGERLFDDVPEAQDLSPLEPQSEEDTAAILYTSGTTGRPKGAMLSHLNFAHSILHFQGNVQLTQEDRVLLSVPATHVTGLLCAVVAAPAAGATLIILPYFKARNFLEVASREKMTYTVMVPAMYNLCLLVPELETFDLSSWRIGHFGGAPMPQATIEALARRLPNLTLMNGYGATETCSPTAMTPLSGDITGLKSVGRVLPCAEVLIVDADGVPVPYGETGEIWIRGPMVVKGYWGNESATKSAFTDGYWHSGDVGSLDEHGFLYVFDRLKDVINRAGYKIYSAEVENVLLQIPGVTESAVVAKPCPVLGERVHAFVSVNDANVTEDVIRAYCVEALADYKVPETYTVSTNPLPRNANGKLVKRALREQLMHS
nr:class I adenylate-forming enzyme family protein [Burkholderia multivorans]